MKAHFILKIFVIEECLNNEFNQKVDNNNKINIKYMCNNFFH